MIPPMVYMRTLPQWKDQVKSEYVAIDFGSNKVRPCESFVTEDFVAFIHMILNITPDVILLYIEAAVTGQWEMAKTALIGRDFGIPAVAIVGKEEGKLKTVVFGQTGTVDFETFGNVPRTVDEMNEDMGITPKMKDAMLVMSSSGWEFPSSAAH